MLFCGLPVASLAESFPSAIDSRPKTLQFVVPSTHGGPVASLELPHFLDVSSVFAREPPQGALQVGQQAPSPEQRAIRPRLV
jgi:hypothetical protein